MMSERTKRLMKSIPNAAAEAVGSNVDLLTEILLRVPAKPLIKFKCVSKHWLSLISDSEFGSNHTRRNPSPPVSGLYVFDRWAHTRKIIENINGQNLPLTLGGRRGTNSVPPLSFLHEAMSGTCGGTISRSSNGLILCRCGGYRNYTYIVCNPTTQKFTTLPKSGLTPSRPELFLKEEPFLCFDPTKSPYYKVVVVTIDYGSEVSKLAVYTSDCASWKIVSLEARVPDYAPGAIWNGGIIWVDSRGVSRLDLNTEKLTIGRLAQGQNGSKYVPEYFGECGGHLLLIQLTKSRDAMEVKELEMDRDDFCWIVRYQVDLTFFTLPYRKRCVISIISVVKGAKENDLEVVFHNRGKVFSYNLECKTVKVLCESCPRKITSMTRQTKLYEVSCQFIESLSPV